MKLVNIGCGAVFHPAWINLDVLPVSPEVRRLDARRPLPFADGEVDAVYHSHVLEHLTTEEGEGFLRECRRVLRPGGVIRVVVPDLEGIARAYLEGIARVDSGGDGTLHEWTRLELTDQLTRSRSGGEMMPWLQRCSARQQEIVRCRAGREVDGILQAAEPRRRPAFSSASAVKLPRWLHLQLVRSLVRVVGGRDRLRAFDEGVFRRRGEVHRVMYDRHSLARLLEKTGFTDARRVGAAESRIDGYADYGLDAVGGEVRKPDSLFMEAVRR